MLPWPWFLGLFTGRFAATPLMSLLPLTLLSVPPQARSQQILPRSEGESRLFPPRTNLRDRHDCARGQGWLQKSGIAGKLGSWISEGLHPQRDAGCQFTFLQG